MASKVLFYVESLLLTAYDILEVLFPVSFLSVTGNLFMQPTWVEINNITSVSMNTEPQHIFSSWTVYFTDLLLTAKIMPGTTSLIKVSDAFIENHMQLCALPILPQNFFF